jgi:AraC-like DNA-binding protein
MDSNILAKKQDLLEILSRVCKEDGRTAIADGLQLFRHHAPTQAVHGVFTASICVVAQGAKEIQLSGEIFRYDQNHFILASLDVPIVARVVEASPEKPFYCVKLEFDPSVIASVCLEAGISTGRAETSVKSVAVSELSLELLDAFVRLVKLLENRVDYQMISPLVTREIIYRLLKSDQCQRIRQMANFGSQTNRITKAVQDLQARFNEPLSIEALAHDLGMSVSSFHQHFKTTTSMSPLQFQKLLRLQEARRLLLSENLDAGTAALRVGYDDASQFSREYKRLFGEPPRRDVGRLKKLVRVE